MKTTMLALLACLTIALTGCTQQQRASSLGGTAVVNIPPGEKLINVTWEDNHLWYLTRPMKVGDIAETYTLSESSSFGILQGKVTLHEALPGK